MKNNDDNLSGAANPWRGAGPDLRKTDQDPEPRQTWDEASAEIHDALDILKKTTSNPVDVQ